MVATFDDGKDQGALRTIGELGDALGIKAHVLRYWEAQFPQLQPLKRSGGRRYYRPEDVALVEEIDRLVHKEGYTLRGAKAALKAMPAAVRDAPEAEPVTSAVASEPADLFPAERRSVPASPDGQGDESINRPAVVSRLRAIRRILADAIAG